MFAEDGVTPVNAGEEWFVQMEGASLLRRVYVSDVTANTVEVRDLEYVLPRRYRHGVLLFVERAK